MVDEKKTTDDLKDTVVRICPMCGVVNPSGPSETCPHFQLARFDGVDNSLSELLLYVAKARREFASAVCELKDQVKQAVRDRKAEIETGSKIRPSQIDAHFEIKRSETPLLALENPSAPQEKQTKIIKRQRQKPPAKVNPKQLELIARDPPKGDA